jgi:hypothetical protein
LTKIISHVSGVMNSIIGVIYFLSPYFLSLAIEIYRKPTSNLHDKLLKQFFIAWFFYDLIIFFFLNYLAASINNKNYPIKRYLCQFISEENIVIKGKSIFKINFRLKLKIDAIIARINEQYVGFYCLNMFKFTNLAALEYLYGVMTTYILINGLYK